MLPFILGLAVGAGAVVAFNKSKKIRKKANELKDIASNSLSKANEKVDDVKLTINATAQCIKDKKAQLEKEEKKVTKKAPAKRGRKPKTKDKDETSIN